ncbi:hypothetical protein [Mesorhizobium sp. CN2-181]|uniref:hypothetical protein n=1 Tax=Mesorhizobium yinganensis TaxID=3157707 RepID=UPI0032B8448F
MTINRYRYFYACAFSIFEGHLVAFVDEMETLHHAESTIKIYLSCMSDVAKAMHAAGIAACDLDQRGVIELVAAMGWIESRETYAKFMMKRFVRFLAKRGVTRERPALSPKEAARLELRTAYEDYLRRQRGLTAPAENPGDIGRTTSCSPSSNPSDYVETYEPEATTSGSSG